MSDSEFTALLVVAATTRARPTEQLFSITYEELRRLAASYVRRESAGSTLRGTDLVHEAYLKLVDQTRVDWRSRAHFLAVAATAMRRILVDQARRRQTAKRGHEWERITLDDSIGTLTKDADKLDLIALDIALDRLRAQHPEKADLVEMRVFAGATVEEAAEVLNITARTVRRHWNFAQVWLYCNMVSGETPP